MNNGIFRKQGRTCATDVCRLITQEALTSAKNKIERPKRNVAQDEAKMAKVKKKARDYFYTFRNHIQHRAIF